MAEKLPLPFGEQQSVPPVMALGTSPTAPITAAGQEQVPPIMTTEQTDDNSAGAVGAAPAPLPTSGVAQPVARVEPVQGNFTHIAGFTAPGLTTTYAPVAIMADPQQKPHAVQEQAAPVFHGLPTGPEVLTPMAVDQLQNAADVRVPTPSLHEHTQVSNALPSSAPTALAREASPSTLFVPQGTKHERSDSLELESASKHLKSEALSSQASATSSAPYPVSPIALKSELSGEEIKPKFVPSASGDAMIPQVSTSVSPDDFHGQLLSAASEGAVPKVIINAAIPAHDPCWPRNKPRHPAFHPSFRKIEIAVEKIVTQVDLAYEKLKEAGYVDDIVRAYIGRLASLVKQLAKLKENEVVALLGDMGIGKSEAYEALVGQDGIAIKSDTGRGTHFPIEGHGRRMAQTTAFEVTIVRKTKNEFRDPVTTSCLAIYAYLNGDKLQDISPDEGNGSADEDEDQDSGDTGAAERQYECDAALSHLLPLLHEDQHPHFGDYKTLTEWLLAQQSDHLDLDAIVNLLLDRIMTLRRNHGISDSSNSYPANSTQEVIKMLEHYCPPSSEDNHHSNCWQRSCHLKKAQLHFDNDLGSEGLIFADVPGRNDPDLVMAEMIETYVESAHRYIIMAPAGRPITKEIDGYIREAIRSKKPTVFVVTKIDDKNDLNEREKVALSKDVRQELDLAATAVRDLNAEIRDAAARREAFKAENDHGQESVVSERIERLKAIELPAAEARFHQLKVEIRNRRLEKEISAQYDKLARTSPGAGDLRIAFISAKEYGKHLRGEWSKLDYEATGVPKLFRLLYRSVASKRMEQLRRLCCTDLPRQLTIIKHVLNKTPIERYHEFKKSLENILAMFQEGIMQASREEVTSWIFTNISEPFAHAADKTWPKVANALVGSWTKAARSPTFNVLCRKYGEHRDRKWNLEIQDLMAGDVGQNGAADRFIRLMRRIREAKDNMGAHLVGRFSEAGPEDMTHCLFGLLEAKLTELQLHEIPTARVFYRELKQRKLEFRERLERLFQRFGDKVDKIKDRALVGGAAGANDDTYVGVSMKKAYEKAMTFDKKNYKKLPDVMVPGARGRMKKVKGDTPAAQVYKKQQNVLRRKLGTGKESVYREVVEAIQKDLEDECNKFVDQLYIACSDVYDGVLEAFDTFYTVPDLEKGDCPAIYPDELEDTVVEVLAELPAYESGETEKTGLVKRESDIEKLLKECLSWEDIYPAEQQD
ncbi:hypothetical protein CBER1_07328 [Cercospora berteroae]|uniref:DUF7605 domain-containing protein n=1 Tax=Cercospora berteroae TaxID=357750 RepID=A0A2S6CL57_9PEZI|nr:hypothetical protein CBER1_07328 [Cercospora berteroae]